MWVFVQEEICVVLARSPLKRGSAKVFSCIGIHLAWSSILWCTSQNVMLRSDSIESPRIERLKSLRNVGLSVRVLGLQLGTPSLGGKEHGLSESK